MKITLFSIITLLAFFIAETGYGQSSGLPEDDSLAYHPIQGKVLDIETGDPIIFASVYLIGTNIGTVSNSEGEFLIKIPLFIENKTLVVSSIGYKNKELNFKQLNPEDNLIKLEPNPIPIEEVTIINQDARELIIRAMNKVPENYSDKPLMLTSFYRETIKQNRQYVAVSEAVLDCYKGSYTSLAEVDRVKIFKGRKSTDVKKMDTVLFKLQGGPKTMFLLDFVKNPMELFDREVMDYYIYHMGGIVNINDKQAYVVDFDQMDNIDFPLYSGKLYIDVLSHAFVGAEFRISPTKLDDAAPYLIRKKPLGMRIDLINASYLVKYRSIEDTWYLNHVRTELILAMKWKKKLFKSTFTTVSEMAVTDLDHENLNKFKFREATRRDDIFVEQVSDFEDQNFWGEYNIIQPEESIEAAIERIGRKLKRGSR